MHSLATLCLLSVGREAWHGLDPHVRGCIYPGALKLQKLQKLWLHRRRMQMEVIERLVDVLGGIDLKPEGTDDGHPVSDPWPLREGDHVIVSNGGKVYHHAIYIGSQPGHSRPCLADMGRERRQKGQKGQKEPRLRIVEFPVFMQGYSTYYIVSYNMANPGDEAAARSKAVELAVKLATCPVSQLVIKLVRNCECFAWFCKTGGQKQTSDQVDAILELLHKDLAKKDSVILAAVQGGSNFMSGLCSLM